MRTWASETENTQLSIQLVDLKSELPSEWQFRRTSQCVLTKSSNFVNCMQTTGIFQMCRDPWKIQCMEQNIECAAIRLFKACVCTYVYARAWMHACVRVWCVHAHRTDPSVKEASSSSHLWGEVLQGQSLLCKDFNTHACCLFNWVTNEYKN